MRESRGEKCVQECQHFPSWRGAHCGEHPAVVFLTFNRVKKIRSEQKMHHLSLKNCNNAAFSDSWEWICRSYEHINLIL